MPLSQNIPSSILKAIQSGIKLPLATKNYPSRGQTAVQELYQTSKGKFFRKKSSIQNHQHCQINPKNGTLAEREYWAYMLAQKIGLNVPRLWLAYQFTTVQVWLDYPDARTFATSQGKMELQADNVYNCALFDWLTGQIDRHDANYLYNYVDRKVILVDSAHSFLKYSGSIPDYLKYFEIGFSKELAKPITTLLHKTLKGLTEEKLNKLVPLKEHNEKIALKRRLEQTSEARCIQDIIDLYRG